MNPPLQRADLPDGGIHWAVLWLLAVGLLLAWGMGQRLSARFLSGRGQQGFGFLGRLLLGTLGLWALWRAVARHLLLETSWPLAVHGFIGALAVEIVLGLYQLEKRIVPKRTGHWLTGLRLVAVLAVLTILVQPVFSRKETRTVDRNVVILLDESESMQQADTQMPVGERLALAAYLGLGGQEGRPPLAQQVEVIPALLSRLEAAVGWATPVDGLSEEAAKEMISAKQAELREVVKEALAWSAVIDPWVDERRAELRPLSNDLKQTARSMRRNMVEEFRQAMNQAGEGVERGEGRKLRGALQRGIAGIRQAALESGPLVAAVDERFYATLPEGIRTKIAEGASRPRRELALEALRRKPSGTPALSLLEQLQVKYTLKFMQFGKEAVESGDPGAPPLAGSPLRSLSDVTGALTKLQGSYPPENLAGVVLLSDVRHNGPLPPEEIARRLGMQGSVICPVVVGSAAGTRDASILEVSHANSIFLGDRIRVKADLKFDRLAGRQAKVTFSRAGKVLKTETLEVPDETWRTSVQFDDTPETKGIFSWNVRIGPLEGEQFPQNNEWNFQAAVSDDRTNVLLIDNLPRWEFRYLRNLFDSRDKSVQLQYVLVHPDQVAGADPTPAIPAAAGRPFGQSEATRLPATPEEWRKFDVIILGDVSPEVVTPEIWKIIRDCVGNRGAMLVLIAGKDYLPHAFTNEVAQELIPVKYRPSQSDFMTPPEPLYRFSLTAEGRQIPIFSQSVDGFESARIWEQMPVLRWRHPHDGVKEGSQVLAWANPTAEEPGGGSSAAAGTGKTSADPAGELVRRKAMESKNALVVASQAGLGKVMMLNFDQTWRFRYGVGDTYHHRFWGQLLRWGAGESLPSGSPSVRLGTDALTYAPGQPVLITARLRDAQFRPVTDAKVKASILRDGQPVASRLLDYRPDSQGIYEGRIEGLVEPGNYSVNLSGSGVDPLVAADGQGPVSQGITISNESNPVEMADLTVDPGLAGRLAALSGGQVAGLTDAGTLADKFGPGTRTVVEQKETSLWDNWIILLTAVSALTAEWILRRRHSLA